jgi:hypothetical protein
MDRYLLIHEQEDAGVFLHYGDQGHETELEDFAITMALKAAVAVTHSLGLDLTELPGRLALVAAAAPIALTEPAGGG